jgi:molecular chaperone GrpE
VSRPKSRDEFEMNPKAKPNGEAVPEPAIADPVAGVHAESAASAGEQAIAEQVTKLQAEIRELMDTLVHRQADFENFRKRVDRERQQDRSRAVASLLEGLLPVLDAFERAIAAHDDPDYQEYRKGFELIQRHLWEVLAKQGLERIEAVGQQFNPHEHHAIERVESADHDDGMVIEELQAGYRLHDRVLRPAMVRVAVPPAGKAAPSKFGDN